MGTTPDASASALATRPHACSDGMPSATSAPDDAIVPDDGDAEVDRVADGALDDLALGRADRADVLAALDAERADDAAVGCLDETGDGGAAAVTREGSGSPRSLRLAQHQRRVVPAEPERVRDRRLRR